MAASSVSLKIALGVALIAAAAAGAWGYAQFKHSSELTAALESTNGQLSQAKGQISQLQTQVTQMKSQLPQLQAQVTREQEEAEATAGQLQQASKPDLPVSVTFRHGLLTSGLVVTLRNDSQRPLEMAVAVKSDATSQGTRGELALQPGIAQVLRIRGWAFMPGQHLALSNTRYRPIELVVPSR